MAPEETATSSEAASGDDARELYDELTDDLLYDPAIGRATMMGYPCVRMAGRFVAAYSEKAGALVVKLPSERVLELIGSGDGDPFEPAGKRFREWVSIPTVDRTLWQSLLTEAVDFARKGLATSSAQLPPTQSSPSPHRRRGTDRPGGAGTRWWSALDVADPVDAEPADVGAVPVHARGD